MTKLELLLLEMGDDQSTRRGSLTMLGLKERECAEVKVKCQVES